MAKYIDIKNTYVEDTVTIEEGTTIYPNVILEGTTKIGKNCIIHMGCYIKDTEIKDGTIIYHSHIMESKIGNHCTIGPYAHIRSNTTIKDDVKIGSFVEIKNSTVENHSKIPHQSYIGDTKIGEHVNIGCGVITANYDGKDKHRTIIEDASFIGCNVNLVAPITIGENALIGAGSTITKDVSKDTFAVERSKTVTKKLKEKC